MVPAALSETGKRQAKYFDTKSDGETFISDLLEQRQEHGKRAVSSEEIHWINVARTELGSLDRLRDVLDHWSRTGKGVKPISAHDAAEAFIRDRESENLNPKTMDDIRWRVRRFGKTYGSTELHQITPGSIEGYLKTFPAGWSRKSHYKRLQPLFAFSKRQRWLIEDPFEELQPPETGKEPRVIYTPEDFAKLLTKGVELDHTMCRFMALSGLAFFRTRELVRRLNSEPVLEWRDILWSRNEVHVREEVGKHTRRSSNERFVPLHHSLDHVLGVANANKREGRVVDCSISAFKRRIHKVFTEAKVDFIENGLRKSAISYWLAAHPEHGVGEVARYAGNSEGSCRRHYMRILTKEQGEAWFKAAIVF
jgi:hypothetical protein